MTSEPHNPTNVASFEQRQREQAAEKFYAMMKPAHGAMTRIMQARTQSIEWMATAFGLEGEYNPEVLFRLLDASTEMDEPPFKLLSDIGWLFRGYLLASSQGRHPTAWHAASRALVEANAEWDDLTQRDYVTFQSLFSVPDDVHTEITEIVNGLSLFSEWREQGKPNRYLNIVSAIVSACGLPTTPQMED